MFWGLIMEPQKRYSQTVKKSFHVSMAALDLCSCTDEPVQVMCGFESRKYLLCTLQKDGLVQCALDLNYDVGDEISFVTNGDSHVHLTGYLNDDVMDDLEEEAEAEEDEEDEEVVVDALGNISNSNIVTGKRPKSMANNDSQLDLAFKINQKLDALAQNGASPAKKSKTMQMLEEINSQQEDSDSDDSDINLSDIMGEDDQDDSDEDGDEEADDDSDVEEDDDDEDDDDEDDDEAEDEDDESEDEEMEAPKMNGTAKNKKKEVQKEVAKKDAQKGKQKETESPAKTKAEKRKEKKQQQQQQKKEASESPKKKQIEGGVIIEEIRMGNGNVAKAGKTVNVYYEGRFKNNNKMFDSTSKGPGFKFRLGRQEVIKGWDIGVAGMKVGGKRRITCPPAMAYGQKGSPPTIPPNSTLVFEVELKGVN